MTPVPVLLIWAKKSLKDLNEKKISYDPKKISKIDAYLRMIIDRSDIMIKEMSRMQKFTEDIQDGLTRLKSYGVVIPIENSNEPSLK